MLLALFEHSYPQRIIFNETFAALLDTFDHLCVFVLFVSADRLLDELFCGVLMLQNIIVSVYRNRKLMCDVVIASRKFQVMKTS